MATSTSFAVSWKCCSHKLMRISFLFRVVLFEVVIRCLGVISHLFPLALQEIKFGMIVFIICLFVFIICLFQLFFLVIYMSLIQLNYITTYLKSERALVFYYMYLQQMTINMSWTILLVRALVYWRIFPLLYRLARNYLYRTSFYNLLLISTNFATISYLRISNVENCYNYAIS